MTADDPVPAGGGESRQEILERISCQLDDIGAKLARIENEDIPGVEGRSQERYTENRRISTRIIAVLAVFALLVLAAFGGLAYWNTRQDAAATKVREAATAAQARANCITGNQTRAADLKAEEQFIPAVVHDPVKAARILAAFRVKDRQRPCP